LVLFDIQLDPFRFRRIADRMFMVFVLPERLAVLVVMGRGAFSEIMERKFAARLLF
jgi:hypothetical protein